MVMVVGEVRWPAYVMHVSADMPTSYTSASLLDFGVKFLTTKATKRPHPKGFEGMATGFRVINMSLHRQLVVAEGRRSRLT